jgi:hypothetical protein
LIITALDETMTYGGTMPALTLSYAGLVNNDSPATLATPPNLAPSASTVPATSNAGSYPINVGGAYDPNYTISYAAGTLTIDKASANIVVTPYNVMYDGNPHTATGIATGVESPNPANLSGLLNLSGTTHTDPGSYVDTWTFEGNVNYVSASGVVTDVIAQALAITSIAAVSPNPRNSVVSSIEVTFSQPVKLSTFTGSALTLVDNGGNNLITSAVTIALVSGSTYQINGLSGLTGDNGDYTLMVNSADIDGTYGGVGTNSLSTSWLMDIAPPTSKVSTLPARETGLVFPVTVAGSDSGSPPSGVKSYDIYASTNGGAWALWTTVPAANPTANFTGQSNTTYAFYSIAHDLAGNTEAKSPLIEASTYVPNLTPPVTTVDAATGTNPSTLNSTTGTFTLNLTGSDPGGGLLTYFEVFVSIDHGAYQEVGPYAIPAGAPDSGGNFHSTLPYQGLTDGALHSYSFYSVGLDSAGNMQSAPTSPNVTFTNEKFAVPTALAVTSFTVEHDSPSRSFVRYLDIGFNESDSQSGGDLTAIVNSLGTSSPDISIFKYDLNDDASSKTAVSLTGVTADLIDHAIELNFGSGGIGNSPNTTAADGYYEVDIALPNGQTSEHHFYRLLGDVDGDQIVDANDLNDIAVRIGETSAPGWAALTADVNGDGSVTALDLTLATRSKGRALKSGLSLG